MRQTKKVIKVTTETDLIICNMCGGRITSQKYQDNFLSVQKTWGYGSSRDGESHSFELCEKCYSDLLDRFKIKV